MMRGIAVKNFRDLSHAGLPYVCLQTIEKRSGLGLRLGSLTEYGKPRRDERAEQKRPNRPLVIGAVPFDESPVIAWPIPAVFRGERPQPYRCEQMLADDSNDPGGLLLRHQLITKGESIELIGSDRCIAAAW